MQYPSLKKIVLALFVLSYVWLIMRYIKWLPSSLALKLYLDRAYYLPMMMILVLFFCFNVENFYPHLKGKKIIYSAMFIISTVFFALSMTTSLHGLVYKDYVINGTSFIASYGIAHYFAMVYVALVAVASFVILFVGAANQLTIRQIIFPVLLLIAFVIYSILYASTLVRHMWLLEDFSLIATFSLHVFIKLMLAVGLVQNNGRYVRNFVASSLPMRIYDEKSRPLYSSQNFEHQASFPDDTKRYTEKKIGDYTVVTEEDLAEIIALKEKIRKENAELAETNELLRNALQASAQRASVSYRLSLTQEIEDKIGQAWQELAVLSDSLPDERTEQNAEDVQKILGKISLNLGYMKQKCMLLLGAKERKNLPCDGFRMLLDVICHDIKSVGFDSVGASVAPADEVEFPFALFLNDFLNTIARCYAHRDALLFIVVDPNNLACWAELEGDFDTIIDINVPQGTVSSRRTENGVRYHSEAVCKNS